MLMQCEMSSFDTLLHKKHLIKNNNHSMIFKNDHGIKLYGLLHALYINILNIQPS